MEERLKFRGKREIIGRANSSRWLKRVEPGMQFKEAALDKKRCCVLWGREKGCRPCGEGGRETEVCALSGVHFL